MSALGPMSFPEEDRNSREFGRRPYSKRLASSMDNEARSIIARAYKRTEGILIEHRHMLEKVNLIDVIQLVLLDQLFLISWRKNC